MLSKRMRTLLETLHEKTTQGKVAWESADEGPAFETSLADCTLVLTSGVDDPDEPRAAECFELRVVDGAGAVVTTAVLSPDHHGAHERYYRMARQLFAAATEAHSGADEALDRILGALGDL